MGSETLGDLELEDARELLLQATSIAKSRWKEKEKAATAVVNILGLHTLAIIQAGAFVRQKRCTLEQYPTLFQQQKELLLKFHSKQHVSTYGNVYTTFEVSVEHLQDSQLQEHLDALNFLHILAFMHNSGITETIFQRASEYASELKEMGNDNDEKPLSLSARHVVRLPEYAQQAWSTLQGRLRWRNACAILESLSIITVHEDEDSITISAHSLVHAWTKERQDYQSRCRAWQSAATILALSCEGQRRFCSFFFVLQPHLQACVSHELEEYTQNMSDLETAQLLFQFADVLYSMNEQSPLSLLVQRTRKRLQDRYEADHEIAIQINIFSGEVARHQGNHGKAVELLEQVVQVQEKLAEDDPSRLASQHKLAHAYQKKGQIDKAIQLLKHVVKIRKEKLAEDDHDRLTSEHELGHAYQEKGQIDEAIQLLGHVAKIRIAKLPEDHPSRLNTQHNLALAYQAKGKIDEAIKMLEHVVEIRKATLAEDHTYRIASQRSLAEAYQAREELTRP